MEQSKSELIEDGLRTLLEYKLRLEALESEGVDNGQGYQEQRNYTENEGE